MLALDSPIFGIFGLRLNSDSPPIKLFCSGFTTDYLGIKLLLIKFDDDGPFCIWEFGILGFCGLDKVEFGIFSNCLGA
jgi:hypothetical protein